MEEESLFMNTTRQNDDVRKSQSTINEKRREHCSVTGKMSSVTWGFTGVIRLLTTVICDKLKADYFLEGDAKLPTPPVPFGEGDGLVNGLHYGPVPAKCTAMDATGLSASYQDAISDNS